MYGQNYGKRLINKMVIKCLGLKKNKYLSFGGKVKGVWYYVIQWYVLDKDGVIFQFVEKIIFLMYYFYLKQQGD